MNNEEIIRSWAEAKSPAKQIEILAQLNAVSAVKIRDIIRENGAKVVADAYENGMTLAGISMHYGIPKPDIRDMIVSTGTAIRPRGGFTDSAAEPAPAPAPEPIQNEPAPAPEETAPEPEAPRHLDENEHLDPYQMAKALETVVREYCAGCDVELSSMDGKFEARICCGAEVITYMKTTMTEN